MREGRIVARKEATKSQTLHGASGIAHGVEAFFIRRATVSGVFQTYLVRTARGIHAFRARALCRPAAGLSQCLGASAAAIASFAIGGQTRLAHAIRRVLAISRNEVTDAFRTGNSARLAGTITQFGATYTVCTKH